MTIRKDFVTIEYKPAGRIPLTPPRPPIVEDDDSDRMFGTIVFGFDCMRSKIGRCRITGQIDANDWYAAVPERYRDAVRVCADIVLDRYRRELVSDDLIARVIEDFNREIGARLGLPLLIRIFRPIATRGAWRICAKRGRRVATVAHMGNLRDAIDCWRAAMIRGDIDRELAL